MKKNIKKGIARFCIGFLVLIGVLFFCRGCIYQTAVEYRDAGGRKVYKVKDEGLEKYIKASIPDQKPTTIDEIVDLSLRITNNTLSFSFEAKEKDPKNLYPQGEANCVGYAAFNAAVANYLLERYKMKDWSAKPVKGKLYLFGGEMTSKSKDSFFNDHDFVIFSNKETKEKIYVDPTVYDYLKIDRVSKYVK